jgi:arylsulfatase B
LYDIQKDPGQKNNVAKSHPDVVAKMTAFYDQWWAELEPTFANPTEIYLGDENAPEVSLTAHDWIQSAYPPWSQAHIRSGDGSKPKKKPAKHEGHWAVKVVRDGTYEVSLRRWPVEADQAIRAELPPGSDVPGASKALRTRPGVSIPVVSATLRIDDTDLESKRVAADAHDVRFKTKLTKGSHKLSPLFVMEDGGEVGAYYAIVRYIED